MRTSVVCGAALSLLSCAACAERDTRVTGAAEVSQPEGAVVARDPRAPLPQLAVSKESVRAYLEGLPKARAVRGSIQEQEGLIEAERYILSRLKEIGYEPRQQDLVWNLKYQNEAEAAAGGKPVEPLYGGPRHPETTPELAANTWHNIIVEIKGTTSPKEVLIVGAHFDAVAGSPGADDNGSGTAALLEIARVLKDRPMEKTVRLVFFNLEEIGVRGAREYVKSIMPEVNGGEVTIAGMMSLEMLGYFTDEPGSQKSPIPKIEGVFDPPTVGDFIGIVTVNAYSAFARELEREMRAAAPGLRVETVDFPPVAPPDFLRSDHAPFMLGGMPALMVTDTSNFRNPNYHSAKDTIETLDMERYTSVVRGLAGAVFKMAGGKADEGDGAD